MITYEIERYEIPMRKDKEGKPHFIQGSEAHRRFILQRTLDNVSSTPFFMEGGFYRIKGRTAAAQFMCIVDDYKLVKWDGLKVKCLEMFIPEENAVDLFHPSDLSRIRRH